jgi:excisionase family DNA binding protein
MRETADQGTGTPPSWATEPRQIQLLTVPEVATRLRVCEAKVWQLLQRGLLRSVKIDTSRRIPEDAVAEYVASLVADEAARRAGSAA